MLLPLTYPRARQSMKVGASARDLLEFRTNIVVYPRRATNINDILDDARQWASCAF
jgi:predicted nucleotidyltransferase